MFQWSKERIQLTSTLIIFFLSSIFIYPLFVNAELTQLVIGSSFILIVVLTFIIGMVFGLIATLFYIFIFGSALFFVHLTGTELFQSLLDYSLTLFFIQSVLLIVIVLFAGIVHKSVARYDDEYREMRDRLNESLTVDLVTGFDSKGRFSHDLTSELARAKRYDENMSLVMLELDYFTQFRKLYGELEAQQMIQSLAQTMESVMRLSDRKYRLTEQRFVLLLPHTNESGTGVVLDKLKEALMDYELMDKRKVTLNYHASTFIYEGIEISEDEIIELMESELKSGAL